MYISTSIRDGIEKLNQDFGRTLKTLNLLNMMF